MVMLHFFSILGWLGEVSWLSLLAQKRLEARSLWSAFLHGCESPL